MLQNRPLSLFLGILVFGACNSHPAPQEKTKTDTVRAATPLPQHRLSEHPYPTFNELLDSIRCPPLPSTPVKLGVSHSFDFSGFHLTFKSIPAEVRLDEDCDDPSTYHFSINDKIVQPKSVPDSLRNHGFKQDKYCGLVLHPKKAGKFVLGGVTYLEIPSSLNQCIGGFCHTELDHYFAVQGDSIQYITIDGWPIGDINNDGLLDQIIVNDDALQQYPFIKRLKTGTPPNAAKCANVQVWTFKNNEWTPLLDKDGNPYFIFVSFESISDHHSYHILDSNWPFKS